MLFEPNMVLNYPGRDGLFSLGAGRSVLTQINKKRNLALCLSLPHLPLVAPQ